MDTLDKYFPILALIALVVGLAGLIFGIVAFKKTSQLYALTEVQEATSGNREKISGLQEKVRSLESRYTGLANLQNAVDQTRRGVQTLSGQLSEVRTQVSSDAVKIADLEAKLDVEDEVAEGPSSSPVTFATPAPTSSPAPAPSQNLDSGLLTPAEDGSGRMQYTIRRGDTPSTVARQLGISLDSLLRANPGIEPRYLRIGQKLNIPDEKP